MYCRFYKSAAALMLLPALLGGCVQATRHSNTMLFGTNTSVGIKVGTDTAQVPSILVGYNRQEAVILPLVANTTEAGEGKNRLSPCPLQNPVEIKGLTTATGAAVSTFPTHPCLLVSTHGNDVDSYSVLASFGGNASANGADGKATVSGGLAQYFATGAAAQILAATGGASVVNGAAKPPGVAGAEATASLFGTQQQRAAWSLKVQNYADFKTNLAQAIAADPDDGTMVTRLNKMETGVTGVGELSGLCQTKADCARILSAPDEMPFFDLYARDPGKLNDAITNWAK